MQPLNEEERDSMEQIIARVAVAVASVVMAIVVGAIVTMFPTSA